MLVKKTAAFSLALLNVLCSMSVAAFAADVSVVSDTQTEVIEENYNFSDMAPDDALFEAWKSEPVSPDSMIDFGDFDDLDDSEVTYEPEIESDNDGVSAAVLTDCRDYENKQIIELSKTIPGNDFKTMMNRNGLAKLLYDNGCITESDAKQSEVFATMQGACVGNGFYYIAFTLNKPKGDDNEQIGVAVVCVPQNEYGNILNDNTKVTYFDNKVYHFNDMTYNPVTDELAFAYCEIGFRCCIYTVKAEKLRHTAKVSNSVKLKKHKVSCKVTSIDYSVKNSCYYAGLTGSLHMFAKLDYDFNVIGTLGEMNVTCLSDGKNVDENSDIKRIWNRQSIYVDENYIYNLLHLYNSEKTTPNFLIENMIEIYDLQGNYKYTVYFEVVDGADKRYEAENLSIIDGRIIIGFNAAESRKIRDFCYYDFTENCFSIKYCIDDNVPNYINNNSLPQSVVLRGLKTKLFANSFSRDGYEFLGWHAYRQEVDKWYYQSADGNTHGWYEEGAQPEGYTKYLYTNKQVVSQTGLSGEHVYMCAQWKSSNKFFVSFTGNGGTGTMEQQTVTHGTATPLKSNTFTKTDRVFKGWNAYWVEKNLWYYQNISTGEKAWYTEGAQPKGYRKYVYTDGQSIKQTVHKGNRVVMRAVWDEFYIYYNADGKEITNSKILKMGKGKYLSGNTNKLSVYKNVSPDDSINGYEYKCTGYTLYRREVDMWYYQSADGNTCAWYKDGEQPNGYTKYIKTISTDTTSYLGGTALPGEHLVLYAQWEQIKK